MKQQFIEAKSKKAAARICTWAAKIVKVDGGYHCFESYQDYLTWKNQR